MVCQSQKGNVSIIISPRNKRFICIQHCWVPLSETIRLHKWTINRTKFYQSLMRQYNAFCTPAGIFLGMALWDIMRSLYLLMSKSSTAYKTAIWRAATATWVCLALFYLFQFMLLDFLANPYGISSTFFGYLLMLNFFLFYWTSFGIALMDMIRIRIFYAVSLNWLSNFPKSIWFSGCCLR